MLVYLMAPYTKVPDREVFMQQVMKLSGQYMVRYPGRHVISPLFNHFSLHHVPALGATWDFWEGYSTDLLRRCDEVLLHDVSEYHQSLGVQAELKLAEMLHLPIMTTSKIFNNGAPW